MASEPDITSILGQAAGKPVEYRIGPVTMKFTILVAHATGLMYVIVLDRHAGSVEVEVDTGFNQMTGIVAMVVAIWPSQVVDVNVISGEAIIKFHPHGASDPDCVHSLNIRLQTP